MRLHHTVGGIVKKCIGKYFPRVKEFVPGHDKVRNAEEFARVARELSYKLRKCYARLTVRNRMCKCFLVILTEWFSEAQISLTSYQAKDQGLRSIGLEEVESLRYFINTGCFPAICKSKTEK